MDLFGDMEESLSPRERWKRKNLSSMLEVEGHWVARGRGTAMAGSTEDEAVQKLAHKLWTSMKIKPWYIE
jgi:hypothetical protein